MARPVLVILTAAALVTLLTAATPADAQPVGDHLRCYKIKDPQAKTTYTADLGGLVAEPGCTIKVPAILGCVPATKTNVTPTPPGGGGVGTPNSFFCYKTKCPKVPKATLPPLPGTDQFGSRTVTPGAGKLLCAPLAGPTTTTATTTTSTTINPCSTTGDISCIATFACIDPSTNPNNCGGCGKVCPKNEVCSGGVCSCASPFTLCGSRCDVRPCTCKDLQFDPGNCGACGHVCTQDVSVCLNGVCTCPGPPEYALCNAVCINVYSDPSNCGGCGITCPAGVPCFAGRCGCTSDAECPSGQWCCTPQDNQRIRCGAYECSLLYPAGAGCTRAAGCQTGCCCGGPNVALPFPVCETSNTCFGGLGGTCVCIQNGDFQTCGSNIDCCGGSCVGGVCCFINGHKCANNDDCCSRNCSGGLCQP